MIELQLVVFDIMGTTVRDGGQVNSAWTDALSEHGLSATPEQLSGARGSSKREAAGRLVPAGPDRARRAEELHASFRRCLAQRYRAEPAVPLDGAEATFRWLRSNGVRVALNTGFDRGMTELLLAALRWDASIVDAVVCGDDVRRGRPDPYLIFRAMEATGASSVRAVANVGDTALDLEAGDRAGVRWNIGVLTGAHDRGRLELAPHTHLVPSLTHLRDLWPAIDEPGRVSR